MYDRALVPIDGSTLARKALGHVVRVAPREVALVAVVESLGQELARQAGIVADVPADVAEEVETAARSEHRRHLREAEHELRKYGWRGNVIHEVRQGKPGVEIVALAAELPCDLIVMATHGRSGIRRVLLGSVADDVLAHVRGSAVLLVRPTADAQRG